MMLGELMGVKVKNVVKLVDLIMSEIEVFW